MNLRKLEEQLKLNLADKSLLERALTHRSFLNETKRKGLRSNERLEFLGDAVLELVISEWLYEVFPDSPEGVLTNLRSIIVRTASLAEVAQKIGLGKYLLMSRGEKESGGQENPSLLANTVEALIGAIYADRGFKTAEKFIRFHFVFLLKRLGKMEEYKDSKSLLQERMQAKIKVAPSYRVLKEKGPDHDKEFTVGVYSRGKILARGFGKSLKIAEENAAKLALKKSGLSVRIGK